MIVPGIRKLRWADDPDDGTCVGLLEDGDTDECTLIQKFSRSLSVCARSVVVLAVGLIRRAYEAAKAVLVQQSFQHSRCSVRPRFLVCCAEVLQRRWHKSRAGVGFGAKGQTWLCYGRCARVVGQMTRKLGLAKSDQADD